MTTSNWSHYLRGGAGYVWIINPVERTAWVLTKENPEGVWIQLDDALTAGEDTQILLAELFS